VASSEIAKARGVVQVTPGAPITVVRVATVGVTRVVVVGGGSTVAVCDVDAERVIASHSRHRDAEVTCVAVSLVCGRIVSGDSKGGIAVADSGLVPSSGAVGSSGGSGVAASLTAGFRSLLRTSGASAGAAVGGPARDMPTAMVAMEAPTTVVQVEFAPAAHPGGDLACLISTTTKACLLRIPPVARGLALSAVGAPVLTAAPVGRKPRDGDFGSSFDAASCLAFDSADATAASSTPLAAVAQRLAFAARPAKRMWIVDVDSATVLSTVK
jgi:hypothetical protein